MSFLKMIDRAAMQSAPIEDRANRRVILSVEGVSKRFCRDLKRSLYYGLIDIGSELVGRPQRADHLRRDEFWALQNINFELRAGDVMGIVGINGCGKTTLMRVIAGLIKPTTGRITVHGRLAPLLALGAGFNPVLTGRENIYANMSVLGLTYDEITERFDEVVEFSEIGYAIDAPVQTYSSGMLARLGFACAINTQPDILLLDEVLAVGDINFRRKCLERLFELRAKGMSLLIVHHSPAILLAIAQLGLFLRHGEIVGLGPIGDIVKDYERQLLEDMPRKTSGPTGNGAGATTPAIGGATVSGLALVPAGDSTDLVSGGDAAALATVTLSRAFEQVNFSLGVYRLAETEESIARKDDQVLKLLSRRDGGSLFKVDPGDYEVRVDLPALGLLPGIYRLHLKVSQPGGNVLGERWSGNHVVSSDDPLLASTYHQRRSWTVRNSRGESLATVKTSDPSEAAADFLEMGDDR